ncbi:universal stress protein [Nodosilinea sp. LEGE 07088]|uniref:universal stress protein n=1 Tax=Nodosilinea sp. LEGE 07088 TaxID=2777968 RepID=UPI00188266D1|nr:universal stress protein [Nodosilinea sp. LEGE 07088]MBE9140654.1 universal stress protein [Nodosilinea sp. LEGE 07088]
MFSKILVALDHGETCAPLFQQAITLAQTTGATLMLLSVLEPGGDGSLTMPPYYGYPMPLGVDDTVWLDLHREAKARGLTMLRAFTDQATTAGVPTEFTQAAGSPGRAICTLAKTWEADLILVGSHGRKGLSELFLGSVSSYVMHHAPCSVMVVDAPTLAKATTETAHLAMAKG